MSAALEQARRDAGFANSYTRLDVVVKALPTLPRLEWFALLGSEWSGCDNIWIWRPFIKDYLLDASRAELDAMMEPAELNMLASLPPRITVYRGCYKINRSGLSWSLDRAMAESFPSRTRYRRNGDQPLLLTGTVSRDWVVLKLDRNEREVISAQVRVKSVQEVGQLAATE